MSRKHKKKSGKRREEMSAQLFSCLSDIAMSISMLSNELETAREDSRASVGKVVAPLRQHFADMAAHGSRLQMLKRMHMLPDDIKNGLHSEALHIVDAAYYSIKRIGDREQQRMFEDTDTRQIGICNVSGGRLERGQYFCLCAIRIEYGTFAVVGQYDPTLIEYSSRLPAHIANGEFELKGNAGTTLIPAQSMQQFNTAGRRDVTASTFILDNPKIIRGGVPFELNLDWAGRAAADSSLRVILLGAGIAKS